MLGRIRTSLMGLFLAFVTSGLLAGCVSGNPEGFDENVITVDESSVRGGAALDLRKIEMQRARTDLGVFHETMQGMIGRGDREGVDVFSSFVTTFFKSHLNPMLRAEWQSRHAELIELDSNLRVLEADMLVQMGRSQEVQRVLAVLQRRYEGRENLLVDFPMGEESPLGEAVEIIKLRLDSCRSGRARWEPRERSRAPGAVSQAVCMDPA